MSKRRGGFRGNRVLLSYQSGYHRSTRLHTLYKIAAFRVKLCNASAICVSPSRDTDATTSPPPIPSSSPQTVVRHATRLSRPSQSRSMDLNQASLVRNRPQTSKNGKPTAADSAGGAYRGCRCPGDRIRRRKISKGKFQPPPTSSYPPDKTPPEIRRLTSAPCAESNTSVDHYDKVRGPDRRTGGTGNTRFDFRYGSVTRASADTDKRRL